MIVYHNGSLIEYDPSKNYDMGKSVYEVIRISGGKPMFLKAHMNRLENSRIHADFEEHTNISIIEREMMKVVEENEIENQNIRIDLDSRNVFIRPVESFYPSDSAYENGVATVTLDYTRRNPNIKLANFDLTIRVKEIKKIENVFEVLLVNEDGKILEGSKSNAFFIKGNTIYTAGTDYVLEGATRRAVLKLIQSIPELELVYQPVDEKTVYEYDCCFLTGTSIDLLPVRLINSQIFDSANNPIYRRLLAAYRNLAFGEVKN